MSIFTTAKTWLSGAFKGFWSSAMTYLMYIAIGITIVLGCAAIWFYKQNTVLNTKVGTLDATSSQLAGKVVMLELNNQAQDKAITDLVDQRKHDTTIVQGLIDDYKDLNTDNASTKAKIRDLEHKSDEIKDYLSKPLPDSVRSVLNGKDKGDADAGAGADHGNVPGADADQGHQTPASNPAQVQRAK